MQNDILTRDEFDLRLMEATEKTRRERLALEAQNGRLQELVEQYAATLERLEAELAMAHSIPSDTTSHIRETLKQLAQRSEAVAAVL